MTSFNATFATAQSQDPLPIELLSFTVEPEAVGNLFAAGLPHPRPTTTTSTSSEAPTVMSSRASNAWKALVIGSTTETRYYSYLDG